MNELNAAHREAQEALPWLANGSLAGTELGRVQTHVHGCAVCRTDLALLHTLRAAGEGPALDLDPDRALARLLPQLDEQETVPAPLASHAAALPVQPGWRARFAANDRSWLRIAVAMQCCAIAVLVGLLVRPAASPAANPTSDPDLQAGDYRMLGASQGVQAGLVVTFKPDTPERELRRIVEASGTHIVGGPTATGAWMLTTAGAPATVAARLRAEPAVTLAEPLGAEGQP